MLEITKEMKIWENCGQKKEGNIIESSGANALFRFSVP